MSKTGAPRKAPLNLNALRAQQADARGDKYLTFEITPEGAEEPLTFRVLRRSWWSVEFLVAVKDFVGDVDVLHKLMGQEEFDRLAGAGFDVGDMRVLFKHIMGDGDDLDEEGISLGESSGSSES